MKSFKYVELGTVSHLTAIQEIIASTGEVQVGENKKKASEIYGRNKIVYKYIPPYNARSSLFVGLNEKFSLGS